MIVAVCIVYTIQYTLYAISLFSYSSELGMNFAVGAQFFALLYCVQETYGEMPMKLFRFNNF